MIKNKSEERTITIDLTGPDGNAFFLLGQAKRFCSQLGLDYKEIRSEMTAGEYENLVKVFDKYFGNFVTLLR
jgi:hypothetical protein